MINKIALLFIKAVGSLSLMADHLKGYSLLRWMKKDKTLALMYHGISGENVTSLENFDGKQVYKGLFEQQIFYLKRHYSIISLDDYVAARKGGKRLPRNPLIITFDDGYRNNFTVLQPLIEKYRVPVTIFLPAEHVGMEGMTWQNAVASCIANTRKKSIALPVGGCKRAYDLSSDKARLSSLIDIKNVLMQIDAAEKESIARKLPEECGVRLKTDDDELYFMSWAEARKLKDRLGRYISFGSHTLTHPVLPLLSAREIERELKHSKEIIEKRLGCDIRHFSYPYGDYSKTVIDMTKSSGYSSAVTTDYGYNDKNTDVFRLKRVCVSNNNGMGLFMLSLFIDVGKISTGISRFYVKLKHSLR